MSQKTKLDDSLIDTLVKLKDREEIEVLVYPNKLGGEFESFLLRKKREGLMNYNVLSMANCVVVKASKKIVLEMANRDDVSRLTINPSFTAQQ